MCTLTADTIGCEQGKEVRLMAGDIIDLARGPRGVRFLFTVAEEDDAADD